MGVNLERYAMGGKIHADKDHGRCHSGFGGQLSHNGDQERRKPVGVGKWHLSEIDPGRGTVPLILDGRTLVPIRSVIEAMGGDVGWEAGEGRITLVAQGHEVVMWLGERSIVADGEAGSMDVAAQSINDRTMVPVRFAAENVGCQIAWIGSTREVIIVFAR